MSIVSLNDYSNGFGSMPSSDVAQLQKALQAGQITGRETTDLTDASGAPLKVESLEGTLKVLAAERKDLVLWDKIPTMPAFNTVEEFNQLVNYGSDGGAFTDEGELGNEEDSLYVRKAEHVKYLNNTRVITHQMQLVATNIGDVVQQEINNGTQWILQKLDYALAYADSNIIPQEFDGIYKQQKKSFASLGKWHDSEVVIDLRGQAISEAHIEEASLAIIENFGNPGLLMGPPKMLSDFANRFHGMKLFSPNSPQISAGQVGQKVNSVVTNYGEITLGYDKFLKQSKWKLTSATATSTKAPNPPVADATTPKAAVADASGKFLADFAGDYYYAVSAINKNGESALTVLATAGAPTAMVSVSATESVDLKFTDGGGATPATGFVIYRSEMDVTTPLAETKFYPIYKVSVADMANGFDGATTDLVRDRNRFIAGTDMAFMNEPTMNVWSFKQLAPLMKMDYANIGPATRFGILLYGTPTIYAPKKMVTFLNVGSVIN